MATTDFLPLPSKQDLRHAFVGKSLHDVPLPSAVLDVSKIKHNCKLMLDAVVELKLGFRAHVKTHKTAELTRLQVGEDSKDVRIIVSTVVEAEHLVPMLKDYQNKGAKVNVLYGIPLGRSKVSRLAALAKQLGPGTVTALVDNLAQLASVKQFRSEADMPMGVFIKADSGYHRAGLLPDSDPMVELVKAVAQAEQEGGLIFTGFYSHNSLSYAGNSPDDAMEMLNFEIDVCRQAARHVPDINSRPTPLMISVGASPTSLSIQNIQPSSSSSSTSTSSSTAKTLLSTLSKTAPAFDLEVHAGVYPLLDQQQIASSARSFPSTLAAHNSQALTILAEVLSTYPTRTSTPEALVAAGTLALGREPCKDYPGWGVVTAWNLDGATEAAPAAGTGTGEKPRYSDNSSVHKETRLIVKRIAQEHGIVGWEDESRQDPLPLDAGDRVRLWVNHACVASVGFGWYLIVDETKTQNGSGEVVVEDVWVRCRGW